MTAIGMRTAMRCRNNPSGPGTHSVGFRSSRRSGPFQLCFVMEGRGCHQRGAERQAEAVRNLADGAFSEATRNPGQKLYESDNLNPTMELRNALEIIRLSLLVAAIVFVAACAPAEPPAAPEPVVGRIILSGDLNWFRGMGMPDNCTLKSRYTQGEPVGFRMTAVDGLTGELVTSAELVVHLTYAGSTVDLPMLYRGVPQGDPPMPIHTDMWTAKWVVPDDAPTGIIQYSVTATDSSGRTAEWRPFDTDLSQLTIVE